MNLLPLVSSVSWPLAPVDCCRFAGIASKGVKVRPAPHHSIVSDIVTGVLIMCTIALYVLTYCLT